MWLLRTVFSVVCVLLILMSICPAAVIVDYETNAGENYSFSGIANPSNSDGGNGVTTALHPDSPANFHSPGFGTPNGAPSNLNNGPTAGNGEAVFAQNGSQTDFQYYFDLGSVQNIQQINAYSYNADLRAPITFTVWGTNNATLTAAGGAGNGNADGVHDNVNRGLTAAYTTLSSKGWIEIAGVGSPTLSARTAGAQITDTTGSLGNYQYILFNARQTNEGNTNTHPFMKEIDIYTGGATTGVDITVSNHSFENAVTGWTVSGGTADFAESVGSTSNWPAPDGIAARSFRDDNIADASPIVVSQALGVAEAGTYGLSYFVADRSNEDWLHYGVELLAGTQTVFSGLSTTDADLLPAGVTGTLAEGIQGDWHNVLLSGFVPLAWSGQPLTLRFFSADARVEQPGGAHNDFALDNIQLSFIGVPEPSTTALVALGLLGLPFFIRRRRRRS